MRFPVIILGVILCAVATNAWIDTLKDTIVESLVSTVAPVNVATPSTTPEPEDIRYSNLKSNDEQLTELFRLEKLLKAQSAAPVPDLAPLDTTKWTCDTCKVVVDAIRADIDSNIVKIRKIMQEKCQDIHMPVSNCLRDANEVIESLDSYVRNNTSAQVCQGVNLCLKDAEQKLDMSTFVCDSCQLMLNVSKQMDHRNESQVKDEVITAGKEICKLSNDIPTCELDLANKLYSIYETVHQNTPKHLCERSEICFDDTLKAQVAQNKRRPFNIADFACSTCQTAIGFVKEMHGSVINSFANQIKLEAYKSCDKLRILASLKTPKQCIQQIDDLVDEKVMYFKSNSAAKHCIKLNMCPQSGLLTWNKNEVEYFGLCLSSSKILPAIKSNIRQQYSIFQNDMRSQHNDAFKDFCLNDSQCLDKMHTQVDLMSREIMRSNGTEILEALRIC